MISILDVANKLQELLDAASDFNQYQFEVKTTGFHINNISDKNTGKNFIPVFVSAMGGQNNPVPDLKQSELNIPITFYFPVRFKEDFFLLNDYLVNVFVGKFLTFGSEEARCNISIPQFGEIVDLDLTEFKKWVDSFYQRKIEVMEPYLSMTINLYLSKSGSEFMYGDKIQITSIVFTYNSDVILTESKPIVIERALIGSSESAPQQAFGEKYVSGYPANLGFTQELPLIIKNNAGYRALLKACEVDKDIQNLKITVNESVPFVTTDGVANALSISNNYYVTNYSRRIAYGSLVGISFTLATRRS